MKKYIIIPAAALAITAGGLYAASKVSADANLGAHPLAQKIAEHFGLDQSEVESFFEAEREDQQAKMQAKFEERLSQAVENGNLTQEQKDLILAKHKDLKAQREQNREEWQNLSHEERQAKAEARQQEIKNWLEANGIDAQYFHGFAQGMKRAMRMGQK